MALPTKQVAWEYSLNNRIVYASINQVMQEVLYTVVTRLIAKGWTVRGSSAGVTGVGAMDGVNRWASATDAGVRASAVAALQSWMVLRDANGYEIMFANMGAVDASGFTVNISYNAVHVVNGTNVAFQPSAADGVALPTFFNQSTSTTLINTATSGDRLVNIWTRPDSKGFRVAIFRAAAIAGWFGMDLHTPVAYAGGITVQPMHGFVRTTYSNTATTFTIDANSAGGTGATHGPRFIGKTSLGAVTLARSTECFGGAVTVANAEAGMSAAPELQGSEFIMKRIGLFSTTAGAKGKVGNLIDWWWGKIGAAAGDTYGNREFICIDALYGIVWPWDGTVSVAGTAPIVT